MQEFQPTHIIHFAAESHVDRSITGPQEFLESNILGTFNILHAAKELWETTKRLKMFSITSAPMKSMAHSARKDSSRNVSLRSTKPVLSIQGCQRSHRPRLPSHFPPSG
ncbi:MAG: GDP-mannose 4,6-dehydratase [Fimbriimonadaceae bacterium]